jgi:hypothetical protein
MTLTMAWIRKVGRREELVFASDSRLSGGADWDCCPKILLIPRGDCLIAFAGSTFDAYPLMLQFRNWVEVDPVARNRDVDVNDIKKRMRKLFNDMRLFIGDLPRGQNKPDPPDCELIFGGWSWKSRGFRLWRFHYVAHSDLFDFEPVGQGFRVGKQHPIIFAGTRRAVEEARGRIVAMLKARNRFHTDFFNMEPFEALRDIIREGNYHDIGGPPQLAKIYEHGGTQVFAIRWQLPREREFAVLGRPLFPKEGNRLRIIDPDQINFLPAKTLEKKLRSPQTRAES